MMQPPHSTCHYVVLLLTTYHSRWVDGLLAAKYVHSRMSEQLLAGEWYESNGRTPHSAGSRLFHNYLPKSSEMKRFQEERRVTQKPSSSLTSNDSGISSNRSSLDTDPLESYIDIEVFPDSSVTSREVLLSVLVSHHDLSTSSSTPDASHTPSNHSPSPAPPSESDAELASHSTPGLPYPAHHSLAGSASSLCSCHAHQMVTMEWVRPASVRERRRRGREPERERPQSVRPVDHGNRCCYRCLGHCRATQDMDNF